LLRGVYTGGAGMIFGQRRLEVVAANVAGMDVPGYLRAHASFAGRGGVPLVGLGHGSGWVAGDVQGPPVIASAPADPSPGGVRATGRALDVAPAGGLFLAVAAPGGVRYTRDGRLRVDEAGRLVAPGGYPVLGEDGAPLLVGSEDVRVESDGTVVAAGRAVGRLGLWRVEAPEPDGGGLYRGAAEPASGGVLSGHLAASNVDAAREVVEMLAAARLYDTCLRVLVASDQALGSLVGVVRF